MSSIYDLPIEYRYHIDTDYSGEIISMDNLDQIDEHPEDKVVRLAKLTIDMKHSVDNLKAEVSRLNDKKKILEANITMVKEYILGQLLSFDMKHIGDDIVDVTLRKEAGRLQIDDEESIPEQFVEYQEVKKIDKMALKKWVKDNGDSDTIYIVKDYTVRIA